MFLSAPDNKVFILFLKQKKYLNVMRKYLSGRNNTFNCLNIVFSDNNFPEGNRVHLKITF